MARSTSTSTPEPARARAASAPPLGPLLGLLRCPRTGQPLSVDGAGGARALVTEDGAHRYAVSAEGIPLFAEAALTPAGRRQQAHYDRVAESYVENLGYPHTIEYQRSLDLALEEALDRHGGRRALGVTAELCCGSGDAFRLYGADVERGVGVDVSYAMLARAVAEHRAGVDEGRLAFAQGDATLLPLASAAFDTVFMLGGIHHVSDRDRLFAEVARILKPGGRFLFREPVSDFLPWRAIRAVVYRVAPGLDHETERPLLHDETVPVLERAGLRTTEWTTRGFLGFCFFMNSDVLVFNRLFRFVPGIRPLTRAAVAVDDATLRLPGLSRAGLQVIGVAVKPEA